MPAEKLSLRMREKRQLLLCANFSFLHPLPWFRGVLLDKGFQGDSRVVGAAEGGITESEMEELPATTGTKGLLNRDVTLLVSGYYGFHAGVPLKVRKGHAKQEGGCPIKVFIESRWSGGVPNVRTPASPPMRRLA